MDTKTMTDPVIYNITEWIKTNEKFFLPPVCNKMMHNEGQCKLFFVGGPNQRKDYHIDCGEELFLQLKGDMKLPIVEQGKHRDVHIKEGQIFLLPACIPHSPQRFDDTVGLVIERERDETEKDGLRYYIEEDGVATNESLFEEWFHCTDLGTQLGPVIQKFFASEQCKTGKPIPGSIPETAPVELDTKSKVADPIDFQQWIDKHRQEIDEKGCKSLFDKDKFQFQVYVYGAGETSDQSDVAEAWIWQWEGSSVVTVADKQYNIKKDDSMLIPVGQKFTLAQEKGSLAWMCYQDPTKCSTWPKSE